MVPFQVGVNFDGAELTSGIDDNADTDETELRPGGIVGKWDISFSSQLSV